MSKRSIHWFRQDLRLGDNPALSAAVAHGELLPIYIVSPEIDNLGAASRSWLYRSLYGLNESLGGRLQVYFGSAHEVLLELVEQYAIDAVFWNRCYEPEAIRRDVTIKQLLTHKSVHVESFNGSLLWEPWHTLKADGSPYRVFTPFFRNCRAHGSPPRLPLPIPTKPQLLLTKQSANLPQELEQLLPHPRWDRPVFAQWRVGEDAANKQLNTFVGQRIDGYAKSRDYPNEDNLSRLAPHLHFGEISPNQAWYAAMRAGDGVDVERFLTQLGWREFAYSLLYHFPTMPEQCLQAKFEAFPWRDDQWLLQRWQRGETGYPIVDAGMRELWTTGYMHNRVRMIVASFLVKNLLVHWKLGERWFWDCLLDADLANNCVSWQWVAGCGADAAPYFRIFNPVTQGEKFDQSGAYTRRYVPELGRLSDKYLFHPFDAPPLELQDAGIELGRDYPLPIVDLKSSRQGALEALSSITQPR